METPKISRKQLVALLKSGNANFHLYLMETLMRNVQMMSSLKMMPRLRRLSIGVPHQPMMMIAWRGVSGEFVILQTLHVIFIDYIWLNKSCFFWSCLFTVERHLWDILECKPDSFLKNPFQSGFALSIDKFHNELQMIFKT